MADVCVQCAVGLLSDGDKLTLSENRSTSTDSGFVFSAHGVWHAICIVSASVCSIQFVSSVQSAVYTRERAVTTGLSYVRKIFSQK